jgi:hypothetical protein
LGVGDRARQNESSGDQRSHAELDDAVDPHLARTLRLPQTHPVLSFRARRPFV